MFAKQTAGGDRYTSVGAVEAHTATKNCFTYKN